MNRLPYPLGLALAARRSNIDAAHTPYSASKESRPLGVTLHTRAGRQYIVRTAGNEALPIVRNARSWHA